MKLTRHHLKPRSRFREGEDKDRDNIVFLPDGFHQNWHRLFGNMTTEEAMQFVAIVMQPHTAWTPEQLKQLRRDIKRGRIWK